jgi:hypothetical protein
MEKFAHRGEAKVNKVIFLSCLTSSLEGRSQMIAGGAVIGRRKTHISSQIWHERRQRTNSHEPKTRTDAF